MNSEQPLFVTRTHLPPLAEFVAHLEEIWAAGKVTNIGAKTLELQREIASFLGVKHVLLVTNGAIALQLAIKALDLHGEILTTPFSYVATANSILWENCTPVFVDIDASDCCIDVTKIEAAITEKTVAILPVHVYGNACNVEEIDRIAKKHSLKVIYDAAHTFGSRLNGTSLLNFGDISTLSFHATKLFHTVEGGAIVTNDDALFDRADWMHTFGHQADVYFGIGLNGKTSELNAAMGLCNLPRVPWLIENRKNAHAYYDALLYPSTRFRKPNQRAGLEANFAYYPIIFESEELCKNVILKLNSTNIFPRRYFWPSLNTLPHINGTACPVSESISSRVLCLPLSHDISEEEIDAVCAGIREVCR